MSFAVADHRFRVRGLDRDTCVERELTFVAGDEREALLKAGELGMVVERVDKIEPTRDEDLPDDARDERTWDHCSRELRLLSPIERICWRLTVALGMGMNLLGGLGIVWRIRPPEVPDSTGDWAATTAVTLMQMRASVAMTNCLMLILAGCALIVIAGQIHARGTMRRYSLAR